jgi:hypothetical protein
MNKTELIRNNPEAFIGLLDDQTSQSWYFEGGVAEIGHSLRGFHFWQGGPLAGWTKVGYGEAVVVARKDGFIFLHVYDYEASWIVVVKEANRVGREE